MNVKSSWGLREFSCLPPWMQCNEYLLASHRPPLPSVRACLASIFYMHSDTINIWTHLLACLFFIVQAIHYLTKPMYWQDRLVFMYFFTGVILCFGFSTTFHTFRCFSFRLDQFLRRLDYCGIALLMPSSYIPWLYYGFHCDYWLRAFYITLVLFIGLVATALCFWQRMMGPHVRQMRTSVFTVFGIIESLPVFHWAVSLGWEGWIKQGLPPFMTGGLYLIGATLYACRLPERLCPGRCDIWFHSHQILHVLAVVGTLINYDGLVAIAAQKQTINYN